jgi:acyl-coenzyme A thioesterase PaaI-like protein
MRYRVKKKQPNSKMCLVCGLENDSGLQAAFYELGNGELLARFTPGDGHQSYPRRLPGGIATAILDETIGRAIMMRHDNDIWGVTVEFTTRFLKPVPVGEEVRVLGRITKEGSRMFEGSGEILLKDGTAAVEGRGRYLKLPIDKIADFDKEAQEWKVTALRDDPEEFEW